MPLHRHVFFIGGFDPKSPRHYHRLYRDAATRRPSSAQQEQVQVGPREHVSAWMDAWEVQWQVPGAASCNTRYAVMRWDDIVRQHWPRHLMQSVRDHFRVYGVGASQGVFGRVRRAAPAAFWLSLVPLMLSLGSLLLCLCAALLISRWTDAPGWLTCLLALPVWLLLWRGLEARIQSEWLLRLYGFTEAQAGGRLPELDQRLDELADELLRSVEGTEAREVMLVAHSTGAMLAVAVMSRVLARSPALGQQGARLSLLTLGHCTPILAWLDSARTFRAELARVANAPGLTWLDVSAPADWAAFATVGPWLGEGRAMRRQVSPRFHRSMSPASYAALLKDRQALHLHYLRPQEVAGGYDVVALTAAPPLLADRLNAESPWLP